MQRDNIVVWLNSRVEKANENKSHTFESNDIEFLVEIINHYEGYRVDPNWLVSSITQRPGKYVVAKIDSLMNKLIIDFAIDMETEERLVNDAKFQMGLGLVPQAGRKFTFVKKYL